MGLSNAAVQRLNTEGITLVGTLAKFSKEDIENLSTAILHDPAAIDFGVKSQR